MKTRTLIPWAVAVVALFAVAFAVPTHAGSPPDATLGALQTGGTAYSGGTNLYYTIEVIAVVSGPVSVEAQIKGKKWKANFPPLTATLSIGTNTLTSAGIGVPATFSGSATLKVKAKFNGKKIGATSAKVTISSTPPVPPPSGATPTKLYDVGFGTNVTLDAGVASTNGLVAPFTYAWLITDTDLRTNATLNNATIATPVLTTLPIASFTNPVVFTDHVSLGVDLDKQYDLDTNPNLVGFDMEQVNLTTYHLRVIVTDSLAQSSTGTVTVASTGVSPAQPTVPLGERQYFTAMPNGTNASTYSWSFATDAGGQPAKPDGSTAVIEKSGTRNPSLRPDKEGDYVLQLSVRSAGVTNTSYVTVRGATYVGVSTCASCHGTFPQVGLKDIYTPWAQTGHATMAQRGIDGILTSHYSESCFACHTVGNNKSPAAVNGGFDDVQASLGWTFPTTLQHGNFAAMPSELKNLSNIQCESCHGPGSQHPGADSKSLAVSVCATCHEDGRNYFTASQWALGPHGDDDGYLTASIEEAPNPSCSKCHSPQGFVDWQNGKTPIATIAGRLTCQACHDPHNSAMFPAQAHQVRVYDTVTLDDSVAPPITLTGQGTSAQCMICHNGRRSSPPTYVTTGSNATRLPHESTATDVLLGIRASTNVQYIAGGATNTIATLQTVNSPHSTVAKCVDCHMHNNGKNTVGNHTFSMTDRLTSEGNVASCNVCHAGVDPVVSLDHLGTTSQDYDGNGQIEGTQTEVDGLMTNLVAKMFATGMNQNGTGGSSWAGYSSDPLIRSVQRNAAWNQWLIERDLSRGVHNTAFTVQLLQWSYTVLSTNTGGNSYQVDYPAAFIK